MLTKEKETRNKIKLDGTWITSTSMDLLLLAPRFLEEEFSAPLVELAPCSWPPPLNSAWPRSTSSHLPFFRSVIEASTKDYLILITIFWIRPSETSLREWDVPKGSAAMPPELVAPKHENLAAARSMKAESAGKWERLGGRVPGPVCRKLPPPDDDVPEGFQHGSSHEVPRTDLLMAGISLDEFLIVVTPGCGSPLDASWINEAKNTKKSWPVEWTMNNGDRNL